MEITLVKPIKINDKELKKINLKLEDLTGADILKIDMDIRSEGDPRGFDNVYNQKVLLTLASKSSGVLSEDLERLSAPDFLEVTFTVRNSLMGLLGHTVEQKILEES